MWWFVNENGACQLCVHDPGFDVDVYLSCTLRDVIYIIRGDVSLDKAISTDRLEAIRHRCSIRQLADWFNLGPITKVASQLGPDIAQAGQLAPETGHHAGSKNAG